MDIRPEVDKAQQDTPPTDGEAAFIRGLVARGEAVRLAPGQALPPGATHEIIGERPDGLPVVKRRRFSAV